MLGDACLEKAVGVAGLKMQHVVCERYLIENFYRVLHVSDP